MSGLPRLCWFVYGMSMLERLKPNAVMLTHGVASTRTLALRLIMFIGRRATSPNQGHGALPTLPCVTNCRATGLGLGACQLFNVI